MEITTAVEMTTAVEFQLSQSTILSWSCMTIQRRWIVTIELFQCGLKLAGWVRYTIINTLKPRKWPIDFCTETAWVLMHWNSTIIWIVWCLNKMWAWTKQPNIEFWNNAINHMWVTHYWSSFEKRKDLTWWKAKSSNQDDADYAVADYADYMIIRGLKDL